MRTCVEAGSASSGSLPYFPRWQAGARLDYLDRNGIRSYLSVNYVGSRVRGVPGQSQPPQCGGDLVPLLPDGLFQEDVRPDLSFRHLRSEREGEYKNLSTTHW